VPSGRGVDGSAAALADFLGYRWRAREQHWDSPAGRNTDRAIRKFLTCSIKSHPILESYDREMVESRTNSRPPRAFSGDSAVLLQNGARLLQRNGVD